MRRWIPALLLGAVTAALVRQVLTLPPPDGAMASAVRRKLGESGVSHDVTAVLLNFRGYDTLLELAVLLTALQGVWSLGGLPAAPRSDPPGPILLGLVRTLLPLATLTSLYILWTGSKAPGGAFQAGAVLGAAGILCLLAGIATPVRRFLENVHWLAALGPALFTVVGAVMLVLQGRFLMLPPAWAGALILAIELTATVSIAAILLALFMGARTGPGVRE